MRNFARHIFLFLFLFLGKLCFSQTASVYKFDASQPNIKIVSGHLQLGTHKNPNDEVLDANSFYFLKNGKPWFPVMGEFHFSRYPKQLWEESILKMKACGIDIIATYVFWIYHEEMEGQWDWTGNRDLHYFAELCRKHKMDLFVRLGPWCHGEVRNGGFPDWLLQKTKTRRNDSTYLFYVERLFNQINNQLKGLYFKDNGPIIGVQIENEFRFNNEAGLQHMLRLKKMAVEAGIDVPYYTATGWPGSNQKQTELIPVWGAYPEAPWDKRTTKLPLSKNYLFESFSSDPLIGNDLLKYDGKDSVNFSGYQYPLATAELGGGNQVTYHRRPVIESKDVSSMAYVKLGSGGNLLGYYMFHGGSNAIGKLSSLQESKATKYPNDYSIINYDFFAPIGEWGELRPSYHEYKKLHLFLNDFGDKVAVTKAFFPNQKPDSSADMEHVRCALRGDGQSAFIFFSNYQRQKQSKKIKAVQFEVQLKDGRSLKVPSTPIDIVENVQAIWPVNVELGGINLVYATAQPLCKLEGKETVFVFSQTVGVKAEYVFKNVAIASNDSRHCELKNIDGLQHFIIKNPGTSSLIRFHSKNKMVVILTLSSSQALHAWKAKIFGTERLLLSEQDLNFDDNTIKTQSTNNPRFEFLMFPGMSGLKTSENIALKASPNGMFTQYEATVPGKKLVCSLSESNNLQSKLEMAKQDSFSSKPLYGAKLQNIPGANYWQLSIPSDALNGVSDVLIKIYYKGDTQAAYLNGSLVADDFFTGQPMMISLRQMPQAVFGSQLVLLVTPLQVDSKIYFEDGVRESFAGKALAEIERVEVLPQYELIISR